VRVASLTKSHRIINRPQHNSKDTLATAMDLATKRELPLLHEDDKSGSSFYRIRCPSGTQQYGGGEDTNPWKSVIPPMPANGRGLDVTIEWSMEDDTSLVAKALVENCIHQIRKTTTCDSSSLRDACTIQRLSWSLSCFRDFVSQELLSASKSVPLGFKARITSSRGSHGTRCPKWHVDYVPVRWNESFVGRGCEVVAARNEGVNWHCRSDEGCRPVVDSTLATIYRANEGEAILLVGKRWKDIARLEHVEAAVHKSPGPIPSWEGRVTLTQDIILE
jgi:Protein of unknown function (DUF1826)